MNSLIRMEGDERLENEHCDQPEEPEDVPSPSYCDDLMATMNECRIKNSFCDVSLVVEETIFPAHKIVLAAGSQFFNGLFNSEMKEKQQKKIFLKEVKSSVMDNILEYIYTGKTEVNKENAHALVKSSSYFLVDGLKELASDFICSCLTLENCLKTREFAEKYNCRSLQENCKEFIRSNFVDIIEDDEFFYLDFEIFEELVANENTSINKEEVMYETVKKWVMKSAATRKKHFKSLFCHIRLQQISKKYLNTVILKDELVTGNMSCMQFVLQSLSAMDSLPPLLRPRSAIDEHRDAVIIIGGFDIGNTPTSSAMCFMPSLDETESWRMLAPLSAPRYGSSSAFCGGFLYSIGGWEPPDDLGDEPVDIAVKTVERYDPTTNTWLMVAPLPSEPERWVTATSLDGKIYVLCTSTKLFSYDPTQNMWECVPSTLSNESEIHGACLVACSGNLYVIGGLDVNNRVMSRALKFDPETLECSLLAPMSVQRYLASAVAKKNKIYVVGGLQQYESDAMGCALGSGEVYNIERDIWEMLPKLQNPRYSGGIACVWDCVFIFGGEHTGETQDNVEYFNEEQGRWEVVTSMPCRSYFSCHWVRMPISYTQLDIIKPEEFELL